MWNFLLLLQKLKLNEYIFFSLRIFFNCIQLDGIQKDGILKVLNNNPDLKPWFDEIEIGGIAMMGKFANCATKSGLRQE